MKNTSEMCLVATAVNWWIRDFLRRLGCLDFNRD